MVFINFGNFPPVLALNIWGHFRLVLGYLYQMKKMATILGIYHNVEGKTLPSNSEKMMLLDTEMLGQNPQRRRDMKFHFNRGEASELKFENCF